MTIDLYTRIWDARRDPTKKLLLLALGRFAYGDPYGVCWPSRDTLSEMLGRTRDWTDALITMAEDDGDVITKTGRGRGNTTVYGVVVGLAAAEKTRVATIVAATSIRKKQRMITIDGETLPYSPDRALLLFEQIEKGVLQHPFSTPAHVENMGGDAENTDPPTVERALPPPPPPPRAAIGVGRSARRPPPLPEQIRWLLYDEGITTAEDFRNAPDLDALIADYKNRRAEQQPKGTIVNFWKQYGPPTQETMYRGRQDQENQPERPAAAPARQAERQRRPRPGDPGYYQ